MWTVIYETKISKYNMLILDKDLPIEPYTKYNIDGKDYDIVPVYDQQRCIAVETSESLLGKEVKFI